MRRCDWSETRGTPKRACGGEGEISPLQVPGQLAKRDIGMLEICHFHLPQTEGAYIRELRLELDAHEIDLYSVLIDAGDVAHPDPEQRACEVIWVREWLELAAELGARCARVIAGDAPPAGSGPMKTTRSCVQAPKAFANWHGARVNSELAYRLKTSAHWAVASTPCPPFRSVRGGKLVYVQTSGTLGGQKNTPIFPPSYRGQPPCTPRLISMPKAKWTEPTLRAVSNWHEMLNSTGPIHLFSPVQVTSGKALPTLGPWSMNTLECRGYVTR